MGWVYTDRLALSTPDKGECNWWYDWFRNTNIMEAVSAQDNSANFVVSGCAISAGTGLSANIAAGVVEVAGTRYDISSGSLSLTDATTEREQFNLIYVNNTGDVKVYPVADIPTGDFALLAVVDCASVAISRIGDLRRDSSEGDRTPVENEIINGKFDIFQRSCVQTNVSGMKSDDRWFNYYNASITNGVTHTVNGTTEVDGRNAYHYSRTVINSYTHTSSDVVMKYQKIKGIKRFFGKKLVLSFWARVDGTQDISALFKHWIDGVEQEKTLAQKVSPPSSGFQKFTLFFEIPEYISGTVGELDSLELNFMFSAGSNLDAESASLGSQDGIFDLSNVELYISEIELPVRQRSYEEEFALCANYYREYACVDLQRYRDLGAERSCILYFNPYMIQDPHTVVVGSTGHGTVTLHTKSKQFVRLVCSDGTSTAQTTAYGVAINAELL